MSTPISFTSEVDQPGNYGGFGLTGAFGLKKNFIAADINWSWSDFEKLDEPVFGQVFSARFGRTIKLGGPKRASFWVGTMNQKFRSETNGAILLSEAIPPATVDKIRTALENVQNQPWYMNLTPAQKVVVDQVRECVAQLAMPAIRRSITSSRRIPPTRGTCSSEGT